jgi:hypothetical protein
MRRIRGRVMLIDLSEASFREARALGVCQRAETTKALGHNQYPVQTVAYRKIACPSVLSDASRGVLESLLQIHAHRKCS